MATWRGNSRGTEEAKVLKRTRFILLKNPWNLTNLEGQKLAELQRTNKPLYRAYMLKGKRSRPEHRCCPAGPASLLALQAREPTVR